MLSRRSLACLLLVASAGCAREAVPAPLDAARAYARAAARGDATSLYAMTTKASRDTMSEDAFARVVASERDELAEQARALSAADAKVVATARLRFDDGEEAALGFDGQRFSVTSAGALPGGARTPEEALDQLRRVLARRSYAGLMRVLSAETRALVERDLRSLVEGLSKPEALQLQVTGDSAAARVPGGHHVRVRRDGGVWRVEDFD